MDSADNHARRDSAPSATVAVGLTGYEYWCEVVAEYLAGSAFEPHLLTPILERERGWLRRWQRFRRPPLRNIGLIHAVNAMASLRLLGVFRALGCPPILHWVGSDYRFLTAMSRVKRRAHQSAWRLMGATHLFDSPELQAELSEFGIRGEVIRLVPHAAQANTEPLPPKPAVLAYWSEGRADFYGRPIVYALARRWPEVPFRVVGPTARDPQAPPNVEFLGFQKDMNPVYRATSVLIRVLPHDSVSAMVLEALARGRDVIYSRCFPHTRHATDGASAAAAMTAHLAEYRANVAGAEYVRAHFSPGEWAAALQKVYARVLRA